jgi:hypothetical protein
VDSLVQACGHDTVVPCLMTQADVQDIRFVCERCELVEVHRAAFASVGTYFIYPQHHPDYV